MSDCIANPKVSDFAFELRAKPTQSPTTTGASQRWNGRSHKKILENQPEDALGSFVKTVGTVKTERRILKYLTL